MREGEEGRQIEEEKSQTAAQFQESLGQFDAEHSSPSHLLEESFPIGVSLCSHWLETFQEKQGLCVNVVVDSER